ERLLLCRTRPGRLGDVAVDGLEDLLPVDGDIHWTGDAQPDLVAVDVHDGEGDAAADHDALALFSADDQHGTSSSSQRDCRCHSTPSCRGRTSVRIADEDEGGQ